MKKFAPTIEVSAGKVPADRWQIADYENTGPSQLLTFDFDFDSDFDIDGPSFSQQNQNELKQRYRDLI